MDLRVREDVGEVLRDYRNYIHPFKQLSRRSFENGRRGTLLGDYQERVASAHREHPVTAPNNRLERPGLDAGAQPAR
jgi:hypothetical protein